MSFSRIPPSSRGSSWKTARKEYESRQDRRARILIERSRNSYKIAYWLLSNHALFTNLLFFIFLAGLQPFFLQRLTKTFHEGAKDSFLAGMLVSAQFLELFGVILKTSITEKKQRQSGSKSPAGIFFILVGGIMHLGITILLLVAIAPAIGYNLRDLQPVNLGIGMVILIISMIKEGVVLSSPLSHDNSPMNDIDLGSLSVQTRDLVADILLAASGAIYITATWNLILVLMPLSPQIGIGQSILLVLLITGLYAGSRLGNHFEEMTTKVNLSTRVISFITMLLTILYILVMLFVSR